MKIDILKTKKVIPGVLMLLGIWFIWLWFFCRFYVPPDHMAVITAKIGKPLPSGQILAGKKEKGIRQEVLSEGRYFLNPFFYDHEIYSVLIIGPGQIAVVTSKVGQELPPGEFLAKKEQKGIWRDVLGPGKYRLNPYGYAVEIYSAVNIPIGFVGVVTSLSGDKAGKGQYAKLGQKGVMENILQPGLYYMNPKEYKLDVLEMGVNQVSLLGRRQLPSQTLTRTSGGRQTSTLNQRRNDGDQQYEPYYMAEQSQAVTVYSKKEMETANKTTIGSREQNSLGDSFNFWGRQSRSKKDKARKASPQKRQIMMEQEFIAQEKQKRRRRETSAVQQLDVSQFVEFPSKDGFHIMIDMTVEFEFLPSNMASIYSKYGNLTETVEKIILPQILSISRLKGSEYKAEEFIVGEGRAKFQEELKVELMETLKDKDITIHSALIRHVIVPNQILNPIQEASVAIQENLTNIEKQETAKKRADLNTQNMLVQQNQEQVAQETRKLEAEIVANKEKDVALIAAEQRKAVADIERQTAIILAQKKIKLGKARANVKEMVGRAESEGFRMKVEAFGDPKAYSFYEMSKGLSPDLKVSIIHAGEGTLWTDIEKTTAGELGGMKILKMR